MLSSYWKDRITKEFRAGEKSIEQLVADYGYSENTIKSILFPDVKNRGKITDAVVKVAPPVRFPVKKGLTIVAGKDPKWVEAGKKAHQTKLKNLENKEEIPEQKEEPKIEETKPAQVEEPKLEESSMKGLNRKQRRELFKKQQAERIELGKKKYASHPTPQQVVNATISQITKEAAEQTVKPKRKYTKKVKTQETMKETIPTPEPTPQAPEKTIEEMEKIIRETPYIHEMPASERKEQKSANILAAEQMINSAMVLLNEAIKLLKQ